MQRIHIPTN